MLQLAGVSKSFGAVSVVRDVGLTVNEGDIVCLLGPSGCGKTTLLRLIAGLEQPDSGDIRLRGESVLHVPVYRRDFGLMFQDFALFPHMTVAENVAFGLKMHKATHIQTRVREVLTLVGLQDLEGRDVSQLSGGERQRVALARSLAPTPRLLMLDEPLGSLDVNLRERLATDLRKIIKTVGLTAIYVTHDQMEAFAIADQVAVMNAGRIEQVDTPETLYLRPQTSFVARFMGLNNVVDVTRTENGLAHTELGNFSVSEDSVAILLHPLGIQLVTAEGTNTVSGQVVARLFAGDSYRLTMQHASGQELVFKVPSDLAYIPAVDDEIIVQCDLIVPLMA